MLQILCFFCLSFSFVKYDFIKTTLLWNNYGCVCTFGIFKYPPYRSYFTDCVYVIQEGTLTPIIQYEDVTYVFIQFSNLYVVGTTNKNSNVMMISAFMHKLCQVYHHLVYIFHCHKNFILQHFEKYF